MLKKQRKNISIIIAVIGLLIFLHFTKILLPVESIIRQSVSPVLTALFSISANWRQSYNDSTDRRDLSSEVEKLEAEVERLTAESARLKTLEEENEILREYLNFFKQHEYQYVLANVISRGELADIIPNQQILIINRGNNHGVIAGLPVLSSSGIIIGKISEANKDNAKVHLTTDANCKLAATIQNRDKTAGIAEGDLGLTIRMNFIPQTEDVAVGDTVVTSGLETNIPRGLVIGKVIDVEKESNEVWQQAAIEPAADFNEMTVVSVMLPN